MTDNVRSHGYTDTNRSHLPGRVCAPMPPETDSTSPATSTVSTSSGNDGGRPLAVYGVLGLGVATLLILLAIIYFSSGDRDKPDQPTCVNITATDTIDAVYAQEVDKVTVNYDAAGDPQSSDRYGPVLAKVDFVNGQCGNLPQGVEHIGQIYEVLGAIEFYNDTTELSQVEVKKEQSEWLADALYWTPTAEPTETPLPTETPIATEPVVSPTVEPTSEPTTPVVEDASPSASPQASPAA